MKRLLQAWLLSFLCSLHAVDDLTPLLATSRSTHGYPAMAAAVIKDGSLAGLGADGLRRVDRSKHRVTASDKFHLGSITKSMTALLASMLVQDGNIRWDSRLDEVFPEMASTMNPACRAITLEQLLAHRSGLMDNESLLETPLWRTMVVKKGSTAKQRLYFVKELCRSEPRHPPGQGFVYSNAGYAVAGAMLEKVTRKSYETLLKDRVFKPLGMKSAGFGTPSGRFGTDQPWGHQLHEGRFNPVKPGRFGDNPPAMSPAGGVHCSLADLGRYAVFHMEGSQGKRQLLHPAQFKKLHSPVAEDGYALGWVVFDRKWARGKALMHSGSNTSFYTVLWMAPSRNFAAMVCVNANGEDDQKACDPLITELIRRYAPAVPARNLNPSPQTP